MDTKLENFEDVDKGYGDYGYKNAINKDVEGGTLNSNSLDERHLKDLPTIVYDKHGNEIGYIGFGQKNQKPSPLEIVPTGTILEFAGSTAPQGFLICDGSVIRRDIYTTLYGVIGTTYGAGDGSTTFALPNRKGRVGVGLDTGQAEFNVLGEQGGAKTHTLILNEIPSHSHVIATSADANGGNPYVDFTGPLKQFGTIRTASEGGGLAHNNLQPYITLNYIIKI